MKQRSKFAKTLAQIAVVVFFSNATYGVACCFVTPDSDVVDTAAAEMPCHTDNDSHASQNSDDCCTMCMPAMVSIVIKTDSVSAEATPSFWVTQALTAGGVDPPFRPPISHLS